MLVDDAFVRDRYQHDVHSPEPYALDMDDARSLPGIAACGDGDGGQSRNAPLAVESSYSWRSRRRTRTAGAWSMRPWPCGLSFWPAHGVSHLFHGGILNPRAGFPMSDLRCQVILDMRFFYKLDFRAIGHLLFQSDSANLRHQILITSKHTDCLLLVFGQNTNWYCKYQTIKLELHYRGLVLDIPN